MKFRNTLLLIFSLITVSAFAQKVQSGPTIEDQYRKKIGNLRLSKSTMAIGKIRNNETRTDTILLYNAGNSEMSVSVTGKLPLFLKVTLSESSLKPQQSGSMIIAYDASKRNDYGVVFDRFSLTTNDADQPSKFINITANIQEYFAPATDGDTTVVKASVSETVFDFGQIKKGEKVSKQFTISNAGSKKLIVRTVKNNCGCIKTTLSKNEILPGETATLRIDYDSFAKEGRDQKIVTMILNDPLMPEVKFEVKGEVLK